MEKIYNSNNYSIDVLYHIGAYENSIHFIFDKATKTCAIVDPAWEPDLFLKKIHDKGYTLTDIWITHWHGDHTNAVDDIANKTGQKLQLELMRFRTSILKIKFIRLMMEIPLSLVILK